VVTYDHLIDLGFSRKAIAHRVRTGRLHRLYPGVYAVGRRELSEHGLFIAAVYACGEEALLSHHCAAHLWGIRQSASPRIRVTVERPSRDGPKGIELSCVRKLHPDDRDEHEGIPVTSVARTLIDLASEHPRRVVEWAFEEAERLRLLDIRDLEAACDRSRGRRGVKLMRQIIAEAKDPPATKSQLERLFLSACREAGIREPEINAHVAGLEVDMVWRNDKIAVEIDSRTHHERRRAFERDRARDAILFEAEFRVLRVTHRSLHERVRALRRILAATSAGTP